MPRTYCLDLQLGQAAEELDKGSLNSLSKIHHRKGIERETTAMARLAGPIEAEGLDWTFVMVSSGPLHVTIFNATEEWMV